MGTSFRVWRAAGSRYLADNDNDRLRIQVEELHAGAVFYVIDHEPVGGVVHMQAVSPTGRHWRQWHRPDLAAVTTHPALPRRSVNSVTWLRWVLHGQSGGRSQWRIGGSPGRRLTRRSGRWLTDGDALRDLAETVRAAASAAKITAPAHAPVYRTSRSVCVAPGASPTR